MTAEQVKSILDKTAEAASRGKYELFKTTSVYDGTAVHPEWLGEETKEVQRVTQTSWRVFSRRETQRGKGGPRSRPCSMHFTLLCVFAFLCAFAGTCFKSFRFADRE